MQGVRTARVGGEGCNRKRASFVREEATLELILSRGPWGQRV